MVLGKRPVNWKKIINIQIYLSNIKTKVAIKIHKKNYFSAKIGMVLKGLTISYCKSDPSGLLKWQGGGLAVGLVIVVGWYLTAVGVE